MSRASEASATHVSPPDLVLEPLHHSEKSLAPLQRNHPNAPGYRMLSGGQQVLGMESNFIRTFLNFFQNPRLNVNELWNDFLEKVPPFTKRTEASVSTRGKHSTSMSHRRAFKAIEIQFSGCFFAVLGAWVSVSLNYRAQNHCTLSLLLPGWTSPWSVRKCIKRETWGWGSEADKNLKEQNGTIIQEKDKRSSHYFFFLST